MDNKMLGSEQFGNIKDDKGGKCKCGWMHKVSAWASGVLWVLSLAALVLAWVSTPKGTFLGLVTPHWFWDSLLLAVLGMGSKVIFGECGCAPGETCACP